MLRLAPALLLFGLGCKGDAPAAVDSEDSAAGILDLCDGRDGDLDGRVDEDAEAPLRTWYRDVDGDGFGDDASTQEACGDPGELWVEVGGDCDDSRAAVNPEAAERCNGIDDDCDGQADGEGAEGWVSWYADADGDGYGDAAAGGGCEEPGEGLAERGGDCDDADPSRHPGAAEQCNGVDDDCDAGTGEEGTALFVPSEGEPEDWTERMAGGERAPATVVVSRPGELRLCEGTRYASLRVRADLSVVGQGAAEQVVISGGGAAGVLIVRTDGVHVQLSNLTLSEGSGSGAVLGEYTAGGALECDADASVTGQDLILRDSEAGVGGGLYARGCAVQLSGVQLLSNEAAHYGGAVAVLDGSVALEAAELTGNLARYGGGIAAVALEGDAEVRLVDSLVEQNEASIEGGGLLLEGASLSCEADPSLSAGVRANVAASGGGAFLGAGASLSSSGCDWGEGVYLNDPDDVSTAPNTRWGDDASFTCDDEACSP